MLKQKMKAIRDWLEDSLRSLFGRISPDGRIIIIILMFVFFCGISIYTSFSTIYSFGKKSGQKQMKIEHIKQLELERIQKLDSINTQIQVEYE